FRSQITSRSVWPRDSRKALTVDQSRSWSATEICSTGSSSGVQAAEIVTIERLAQFTDAVIRQPSIVHFDSLEVIGVNANPRFRFPAPSHREPFLDDSAHQLAIGAGNMPEP